MITSSNVFANISIVIVSITLIVVLIWMAIVIYRYIALKHQIIQNQYDIDNLHNENKSMCVEYSTHILDFIRNLISQIAILKFRTFSDGHDITKVTKMNIEKLVTDVANTTKKSINISNINIDETLLTKEFYDMYIIETSIIVVKELFEKFINDVD